MTDRNGSISVRSPRRTIRREIHGASVCLGHQATPVHASKLAKFAANQGKSGGADRAAGATQPLDLGLFSHLKGIIDLNPEAPHCAFQFRALGSPPTRCRSAFCRFQAG